MVSFEVMGSVRMHLVISIFGGQAGQINKVEKVHIAVAFYYNVYHNTTMMLVHIV